MVTVFVEVRVTSGTSVQSVMVAVDMDNIVELVVWAETPAARRRKAGMDVKDFMMTSKYSVCCGSKLYGARL
jgi:hypothetical protein